MSLRPSPTWIAGAVLACLASHLARAGEDSALRVPITRDTWVSAYRTEEDANLGGASRLKAKSIQELFLLDIDPSPLAGRVIRRATLSLQSRSPEPLRRMSVSTLATPFVEGRSRSYGPEPGASTFREARQGEAPWATPDEDITAVMQGLGHTIWRFAEATPPDAEGWQRIPVEPAVVAARVAGISHGFAVMDDVGSEYTRRGEEFEYRLFPNRFVASREAGERSAPFLRVELGEVDREPPGRVDDVRVSTRHEDGDELPAGEAIVTFATPEDRGPAGTIGFRVQRLEDRDTTPLPAWMVPMAGASGERVRLHLRGLGLSSGETISLAIAAVDAAGNVGSARRASVRVSARREFELPDPPMEELSSRGALPKLAEAEVAVIDPWDKVDPQSAQLIPARDEDYLRGNWLWSASERRVRLQAARNEHIAFQVLLRGAVDEVEVDASFESSDDGRAAPTARVFEPRHVRVGERLLPDPLVDISSDRGPRRRERIAARRARVLFVEVYVPHDAAAGEHRGAIVLRSNGDTLRLVTAIEVWRFTLPNRLSFVPQMNCYGLPGPPAWVEHYRLAHEHRTCLNRLAYNWRGQVGPPMTPRGEPESWDWSEFDERHGPLFDGSAFAGLPRGEVPVEACYLPINENWPMDIHRAFLGGYWIEDAFGPGYWEAYRDGCRRFVEHLRAKGWTDTCFELYLNNKVYFKQQGGWSRTCAPWIFDEPVHTQDFWALRRYGLEFHAATQPVRGDVQLGFRGDISRPQWQRDLLDGVLDVNVVGGPFHRYAERIRDRKRRFGEIVYQYGSANPIDRPNVQPIGWSLDVWSLGADGVLPWQTIGRDESWERADANALFYPGQAVGRREPIPSVRLKAFRRGQQDVEYLTLLGLVTETPRDAIGRAVRERLGLEGTVDKTSEDDAGTIRFDTLDAHALWRLRTAVGAALDRAAPPFRERLVDLRPRVRDLASVPSLGYVTTEARAPRTTEPGAEEPAAIRGTRSLVVAGRPRVADAIIDFQEPTRAFGAERRDNRLVRQERGNALLLRFDLGALPAGAEIVDARVSVLVWDPSSRASTRVAAYAMTSAWDEATATWSERSAGTSWSRGQFRPGADTRDEPESTTVVRPETPGEDLADPPVEVSFDLTALARRWAKDPAENLGVALVPLVDRQVDDGHWSRFQVWASEAGDVETSPRLVIRYRP